MIVSNQLTLHIQALPEGNFFIWGTEPEGGTVDPQRLRTYLFMWHARSYYGTMIQPSEWAGQSGLLISPLTALDLFTSTKPSSYIILHKDDSALHLQQVAPLLREVLQNGWFAPSFASWQEGKVGWRLLLPEGREGLALLNDPQVFTWLEQAIHELIQTEPDVWQVWEEVCEEHESILGWSEAESSAGPDWLDEEEWLFAVGWKRDEAPFRICLQLMEPLENETVWHLNLLLQDKSDPTLYIPSTWAGELLDGEFPPHWHEHIQTKLAKDRKKIRRVIPWLMETDHTPLTQLTDDQAWRWMNEGSVRLAQVGYTILLPEWWEELKRLKPKLKAKVKSSVGATQSMFGLNQIVQFDWKVAVGDISLTEEEFVRLAAEKKRLLRIRGRWIQLDPHFLQQIQRRLQETQKREGLSFREVLEMHLLGGEEEATPSEREEGVSEEGREPLRIEVELNRHLEALLRQLGQKSSVPLVEPPPELHAFLRKYQQEGVSWLLFLRKFGLGACLADDMGLGKTIQFISYLLASTRQTPALLICPTSVLGNWQKELERFAPSLRVYLHYGPQRTKGEEFVSAVQGYDLVLTSYALTHLDQEELGLVNWDTICLDEAQNIKNAHTKQSIAIRNLAGGHRIALTGTPVENRLTELWSIFDFINPGYLGSLHAFSQKYVTAIEKKNDALLLSQVQKLVNPFLLRRLKKDPSIQLDLPDKYEDKTYISLTLEQAALYENIVKDLFNKIDKLTGMEKKGLILASLTKLKQICDHPALFLKERGQVVWEERSDKITRLLEMIQELRDEGDKCLIFTQYVEMGELLKLAIEQERGERVQFLHGGVPKVKRDEMIARFEDTTLPPEETCNIFILSLRAGGTGLNLVAANHVFHFDRWWNPAVENQATDRAFRIGQTKDVQVHKFVTLGTLEERIDEMIERKQELSQQVVEGGEGWITEMSTDELKELFALRREWVGK